MNLIITPLEDEPPLVSIYFITVEYEHGDCDFTSHHTYQLKHKNKDDLIKFINRFNAISDIVDKKRFYDEDFPSNFKEALLCSEDPEIHLEGDQFYEHGYAGMIIEKIKYYDEHGKVFKIDIEFEYDDDDE